MSIPKPVLAVLDTEAFSENDYLTAWGAVADAISSVFTRPWSPIGEMTELGVVKEFLMRGRTVPSLYQWRGAEGDKAAYEAYIEHAIAGFWRMVRRIPSEPVSADEKDLFSRLLLAGDALANAFPDKRIGVWQNELEFQRGKGEPPLAWFTKGSLERDFAPQCLLKSDPADGPYFWLWLEDPQKPISLEIREPRIDQLIKIEDYQADGHEEARYAYMTPKQIDEYKRWSILTKNSWVFPTGMPWKVAPAVPVEFDESAKAYFLRPPSGGFSRALLVEDVAKGWRLPPPSTEVPVMDPDTSELWQVTRIACRSEKVETAASAIGGVLQELPPVTFDFHLADDLTISGEGDSVIRKQIAVWNKDLSFVPIFRQCADGRVTFLYALRTKPRT